ncbi:glycosyltransferase family 1 protein [Botryobasidium botryosum FD-172 SS1]|uniref:sterol 3beta-glucosyltransferase n=1 Tax=Botryobasidium botryosum (strain FD-172 SS1) TaxID=930990 RepID=A0A067MEK2_BOTB1|nr:glycosyltransferase family 1 protein [Botryobasidium botryosum FD-172 SS1]
MQIFNCAPEDELEIPRTESPTSTTPPDEPDVVKLLIEEFGEIAADGEEEVFVGKGDTALFEEITILGTMHVTTHRISFHASLLSTQASTQVVRSGSVTINPGRLRRKQRVWLELTHDMITTYPDATEEGRVRPRSTILLSLVKSISAPDPKDPRTVQLELQAPDSVREFSFRVDTVESALGWRRDINGALYMHRHRRKVAFEGYADGDPSVSDPESGVRICIPLHRISNVTVEPWQNFATVVTLNLEPDPEPSSPPPGPVRATSTGSLVRPEQVIIEQLKFGFPAKPSASCAVLPELIEKAKARNYTQGDVIVDFGPLTFAERDFAEEFDAASVTRAKKKIDREMKKIFGLGSNAELWHTRASLNKKALRSSGFIGFTPQYVCFWSKSFASQDIKFRFSTSKIHGARAATSPCGTRNTWLLLEIEGHRDLSFHFANKALRDEVIQRIQALVDEAKRGSVSTSPLSSPKPTSSRFDSDSGYYSPSMASPERKPTLSLLARNLEHSYITIPPETIPLVPKPINLPSGRIPHISPRHFCCLTIGSRGDVQPYIALALGLQKQGHKVTIITHEEYKDWVEGWGVGHRTAGGDPAALMKLSVENSMFSPQFFKESLGNFRDWLDELLLDAWKQCHDADVLIESPSAMAGVHIAEALKIPYIRCFTMPWTRTTAYPHAFMCPAVEMTGSFNYSTVLFDNVFWTATSSQINRWRKKTLQLKATDMSHLAQTKIPFIYNFSSAVVPKPLDWKDTTIISGYWFLDNADQEWTPPESLLEFMSLARKEGKPLVYIGFGSIVVPNPRAMTKNIIKAVLKSDVRAIVSKGWSARMAKDTGEPEIEMPPECYSVDKIPHDWLFPQIDAALHHGGAGTTGASLRAGIPTLIKPWFGDQHFWSMRVQKLGAGLRVASLSASDLADALKKATSDRLMKEKAAAVGEKIRSEDGVTRAIESIFLYLPRAAQDRMTL